MIDYRNPYTWDNLNDSVKEQLGSSLPVRVYQSIPHALLEISMAFQVLYSHKRQYVTSLASFGNHADEMTVYLSRQGIKAITGMSTNTPGTPVLEGSEIDDKKTLFHALDIDDAITGQIYVSPQKYQEDSKTFRVFISHSRHLAAGLDLDVNESDIHILYHPETGGAVALFGRRTQNINSLFGSTLNWDKYASIGTFAQNREDKKWVASIESQDFMGSKALFATPVERLFDRAIVFWKNQDASAIRDILIRDYQVSPLDIECLSLTRWQDTKVLGQFQQRGWDADTFRGTLLLSSRLSGDKDFSAKLLRALKSLS